MASVKVAAAISSFSPMTATADRVGCDRIFTKASTLLEPPIDKVAIAILFEMALLAAGTSTTINSSCRVTAMQAAIFLLCQLDETLRCGVVLKHPEMNRAAIENKRRRGMVISLFVHKFISSPQ